MIDKNDGGPRFMTAPEVEDILNRALAAAEVRDQVRREKDLRDYFAGQALAGLAVGVVGILDGDFSAYAKGHCNVVLANRAYAFADAMLKEREK